MSIVKQYFLGMSQDDRLGREDEYVFSENIDTLTTSSYIQLVRKPVKSIDTTTRPLQFLRVLNRVSNSTSVYAFCQSGKVYREGSDTPVYDNPALGDFKFQVFTIGEYIYFVNSAGPSNPLELNRISINASAGNWGSVTNDYKPGGQVLPDENFSDRSPFVIVGSYAYLGVGDKIARIDTINNTIDTYTQLLNTDVVFMSYTGGVIRLYTEDGKLHLWNGNGEAISESIDLGVPLSGGKQFANIDYLVGGGVIEKGDLYALNGYTLQPIIQGTTSRVADDWKGRLLYRRNSDLTIYKNMVTFADQKIGGNLSRIGHYGNTNPALPDVYSIGNTKTHNDSEMKVECMFGEPEELFIGFSQGPAFGVSKVRDFGNYETEGFITMLLQDGGDKISKKSFKNLVCRVENIDATHTIDIEIDIDGEGFVPLATIDNTSNIEEGIWRFDISSSGVKGYYRDYSLKFILKSPGDSTSPRLYAYMETDAKTL